MKLSFFILLINITAVSAQQLNMHSPENIRKFAARLFCERDYYRFILEYGKLGELRGEDLFKTGIAWQKLGEFEKADSVFSSYPNYKHFMQEHYNTLFLKEDYKAFQQQFDSSFSNSADTSITKLYMVSYLLTESRTPPLTEYEKVFGSSKEIKSLYERRVDPGMKNPAAAAILSAVIPGLGKIYTGQTGDGITAFLTTGVLVYLSYSNFKADHDFRGWLFGGLAAVFYGGNIYGSAASAQIYNAGIRFNFEQDVKLFVTRNNNFMPDYGFCR